MKRRNRSHELEETYIKKLVIVDCHGVTLTKRGEPHNPANEVTVEYPTILTANLGSQTRVCGNLDNQADQICSIMESNISQDPETFLEGTTLQELVSVLKKRAVNETGFVPSAVFTEGTPIKPKLPGEKFQNIELFCPGVRIESGLGNYPVGNTDGVWVCDLDVDRLDSVNHTNKLFKNQIATSPRSRKVIQEDQVELHPKLKKYIITKHSWVNYHDGSPVTYRNLVEKLKEAGFPTKSTAILLATCRGFDDDNSDMDDDGVPSATEGGTNKNRRYTKRKKYFKSSRKVNKLKIKKRRTRKYKNKK